MGLSEPDDPYLRLIQKSGVINGRYCDMQPLGHGVQEGFFSFLFQAKDMETGQEVALKFFNPNHNYDQYRRAAFSREAQLLGEFSGQPNILQLLQGEQFFNVSLTTPQGDPLPFQIPFIVTELADGSLKHYIYSEYNNPRDSLILFRETCKGLQRIHRKQTVHRDLKPDNCLIFRGRLVKLCDFGTARRLNVPPLLPKYDWPVGDQRYTALEIFCGMGNDPKYFFGADFFSLGAILFELFTRQILTQLVYDNALSALSQFFINNVIDVQRRQQLDALLPKILNRWVLPDLYTLDNLVPKSILRRVNVFYQQLADLDYLRRALVTFESIFREIDMCLKILEHEESYGRWLKYRRSQQEVRARRSGPMKKRD